MPAQADKKVVFFVGPTLAASAQAIAMARRYKLRPPVKRFDVTKLLAVTKEPGVLVIVDGVFHDTLAVGHAELRDALETGWQVWGLSSMGAIRARELTTLGMRGFGRVFDLFAAEGDFQDDEVALLHESTPPYRSVTDPLVHLRAAVDHLVARDIVGERDARAVVAELKSRWYGERTRRGMIEALAPHARGGVAVVREELREFQRFALKTLDLERFLEERPWVVR